MIRFQIGVSKKECKEGNIKDIEKVKCFSVFLHEWCFVFQTRFVRCDMEHNLIRIGNKNLLSRGNDNMVQF